MHLAADLFVRPVADREIGPPLRICRGDRPVRLADRKAPPGLVVAEGGPFAMHAERVERLGRRRRMAGCHNPPGKNQKPHPAHAVLFGGCAAGSPSPPFKRLARSACACISAARRLGNEWVSTCTSQWSP